MTSSPGEDQYKTSSPGEAQHITSSPGEAGGEGFLKKPLSAQ